MKEIAELIPHVECLIFASEKPLTTLDLTELLNNSFGFMDEKISLDQVESAMEGVIEKYNEPYYPFEVRMSGGGWQFLTKRDYHKTVAQLNGEKFMKRLSAAALETLAIIAYKQPITKGEIEAIRGVNSDYTVQKLLEKELVSIAGRNEKMPGHPLVYATSKNFMDYFGINSADDLPKIKEVLADQLVIPTMVNNETLQGPLPTEGGQETGDGQDAQSAAPDSNESDEEGPSLSVQEDGELVESEDRDEDND